jgi:alpha-ribazole phosphatase
MVYRHFKQNFINIFGGVSFKMKSYVISLVRNGLTDENLAGRYIGHTDVPLSSDGEKQLRELSAGCEYPTPEAVFSSPLSRCMRTAQIIYPDSDIIRMNELIECDFGEFEGKTADELKEHPVFLPWLTGEPGVSPPFGESGDSFKKRVCECFCKIAEGMIKTGIRKTAIVTHGGVIATILSSFGLPEAPAHQWFTANGRGYNVRITPYIWMRGNKMEVFDELPTAAESLDEQDIFKGFDVKDFLYD